MKAEEPVDVDVHGSTATVRNVRLEQGTGHLALGTGAPRLSWQVATDDVDWMQSAYEIELNDGRIARVRSVEQVLVPWPFSPLPSRARVSVRVRVASGEKWSAWSDPVAVEVGLLELSDWTAHFITPTSLGGTEESAPVFQRSFVLRDGIFFARLYISSLGSYLATLNQARVGDQFLTPGWTSYRNRLPYQTYDVTGLISGNENRLKVLLGNGRYRGRLGDPQVPFGPYGDRLALIAQLEVYYSDGSIEVIGTDENWLVRESGISRDDIYDGDRTDLRERETAADTVDVLEDELKNLLVAADRDPIKITEIVPAARVWRSKSGNTLVDFGQNMVGWVRLRARNTKSGDEIVVRHAEVLQSGELAVRPLRSARATDTYVVNDAAEVTLEPRFTFHGFRYAEVSGAGDLREDDVDGVVVGADLRRIGWFSCSDRELEQLHRNVVWSMRGNFLDVPTDSPQRDERLGWTGDIQVFAPTACFLYDVSGFLSSWLVDLAADQRSDGSVPWVIPEPPLDEELSKLLRNDAYVAAAWGDAATTIPWELYQEYGDTTVLSRQFDSMRRWVDKVFSLSVDGVRSGGFQWGDWLDPIAPAENPFAAKADPDAIATAYLAHSAQIVSNTARVLGEEAIADVYGAIAKNARDGFVREYVAPSGRVLGDAPTVSALAIVFDLLPTPQHRKGAARQLTDLVRESDFRSTTGFVGTPSILHALTEIDRPDLAYRLLLQKRCPSWLYPVTMGATTTWERWDSILPDGTINTPDMTSLNHYAFGAVADWLHRTVAGLSPAAPGYREIRIRPIPFDALRSASARHLTPYGEASVCWSRRSGLFNLDIVVPVGTTATVYLPDSAPLSVKQGTHSWTVPDPCLRYRPITTIRDLIDATDVWTDVIDMLIANDFGSDEIEIAQRLQRHYDRPVESLPQLLALPRMIVDERLTKAYDAIHDILTTRANANDLETNRTSGGHQ